MRRTACSGKQMVSKSAFLNMLGEPNITPKTPIRGAEANERAKVLIALNYTNGNKARAAAILGMTVETLERKLAIRRTEPQYTTPSTRNFYESIKADWRVGVLNEETLEVCVSINLPHGTNIVSSNVRSPV